LLGSLNDAVYVGTIPPFRKKLCQHGSRENVIISGAWKFGATNITNKGARLSLHRVSNHHALLRRWQVGDSLLWLITHYKRRGT
jgi:hypothetical protein